MAKTKKETQPENLIFNGSEWINPADLEVNKSEGLVFNGSEWVSPTEVKEIG